MVIGQSGLTKEGERTLEKMNALFRVAPSLGIRMLREIGADAEKEVKARTPIDSASMVSTVRKDESRIRGGVTKILIGGIRALFSLAGKPRKFVDYSKFVEEGTIRQPGKHMLIRGVNTTLTKKDPIFKRAFDSWIAQFK